MNSKSILFVFPGMTAAVPDFDLLLRAFAIHHRDRHHDRLVLIVKDGNQESGAMDTAGLFGLSCFVSCVTCSTRNGVDEVLRSADVVVLPDGRSAAAKAQVKDVLRVGKPIVATASMVFPRDAVVSVAPQPEALAAAMRELADDTSLRDRLAEGCRQVLGDMPSLHSSHEASATARGERQELLAPRRQRHT